MTDDDPTAYAALIMPLTTEAAQALTLDELAIAKLSTLDLATLGDIVARLVAAVAQHPDGSRVRALAREGRRQPGRRATHASAP